MTSEYELYIDGGDVVDIYADIGDLNNNRLSPPTKSEPTQFPVVFTRGDGSTAGHGAPQTLWHWAYLTSTEVSLLRGLCTVSGVLQKSRQVRIRTRKPDDPTTFGYYIAWLNWPADIERNRQPAGFYTNVPSIGLMVIGVNFFSVCLNRTRC
jgi:hypothetical protein